METFTANNRKFTVGDELKVWHKGAWYKAISIYLRPRKLYYPKSIYEDGLRLGRDLNLIEETANGWARFEDRGDQFMVVKIIARLSVDERLKEAPEYPEELSCSKYATLIHSTEEEYDPLRLE